MPSLDYDKLYREVNATIEDNALYRDYVRSAYAAMHQFGLLLSCADSIIEQHGFNPEDRLGLVAMLLRLMEGPR